jgi:stage V sporulation protein SpoVS
MPAGRPCIVCAKPAAIRQQIDDALLGGTTAVEVARAHGLGMHSVRRHHLHHLQPKLAATRAALGLPAASATPSPSVVLSLDIPSIASRFSRAVDEAESIIADARAEGQLALRAVGAQALAQALTRAAAVARMLAPPEEPSAPALDASRVAAVVLAEVDDPALRSRIAARLAEMTDS